MKRLNPDIAMMLERSRLYNFFGYSSSEGFKSLVEVTPLRDYQFFLPNCFLNGSSGDEDLEYFESQIKFFLKDYLLNWARKKEETEKDFDSLGFGSEAISFFNGFNRKELFDKIATGTDHSEIKVEPNNTIFKVKRFGDILGLGIKSASGNPHKSDMATLSRMCYREDPNTQMVSELRDRIKVSISFAGICPDGEFGSDFFDKLRIALPYVSWRTDFRIDDFIERYKKVDDSDFIVGSYRGFNILMDLVHGDAKDEQDIKHVRHYNKDEARILRRANVDGSGDKYHFKSRRDLVITFTLKSSLSNFMGGMDINFDAHEEQYRLVRVGSIFSSQLCSMVVEGWLDYLNKIDEK